MTRDADHWIRALGMQPHREGGHFRETWRSPESVAVGALPERFDGPRALGTAIYYLLRTSEHSCLHRLRADEVWHLYDGGPLQLHVLTPEGEYRRTLLGLDLAAGESPQVVVPHGCWFGAETPEGVNYALAGCTVHPGFEYEDHELGVRDELLARHPDHRELILRLTR